jgi:hypothetical protein
MPTALTAVDIYFLKIRRCGELRVQVELTEDQEFRRRTKSRELRR